MTRFVKIALAGAMSLWGLLGVMGNLSHYSVNLEFVAGVMAMSDQMLDTSAWWAAHAITNPVIVNIGFAFIYLSKLATGILCALGAWRMWQARAADGASFQRAKTLVILGAGISIFMLFFGFIIISGIWFSMWQASYGLAIHQFAFIYMAALALIASYVNVKDD